MEPERIYRLDAMIAEGRLLRGKWNVLDDAAWARCEARSKLASLAVAQRHADVCGKAAVAVVVALLERRIAGDEPSADEWRAAARTAAAAAAWAAEAAAEAAARAARAAAAAAAAWAARTAAEAAWAAAWAAARAAWDYVIDATLDAIEGECAAAEQVVASAG